MAKPLPLVVCHTGSLRTAPTLKVIFWFAITLLQSLIVKIGRQIKTGILSQQDKRVFLNPSVFC